MREKSPQLPMPWPELNLGMMTCHITPLALSTPSAPPSGTACRSNDEHIPPLAAGRSSQDLHAVSALPRVPQCLAPPTRRSSAQPAAETVRGRHGTTATHAADDLSGDQGDCAEDQVGPGSGVCWGAGLLDGMSRAAAVEEAEADVFVSRLPARQNHLRTPFPPPWRLPRSPLLRRIPKARSRCRHNRSLSGIA